MIASIMQPTYLPWAGYFNLILKATIFLFLDDAQFSVQSWQQRNRVLVNCAEHVLTVPVVSANLGPQRICDVKVLDSGNWRKKHICTLRQAYAKHPFGKEVANLVEGVLAQGNPSLSEINKGLIKAFCRAMGIESTFHESSALGIGGDRSDRLLAMCRHFKADTYRSAVGARDYIEQDGVFQTSDVKVVYQEFVPPPYLQRGCCKFTSHLSIVDLLANVGFEEGRKYVEQTTC
jgi:hypothetical protein